MNPRFLGEEVGGMGCVEEREYCMQVWNHYLKKDIDLLGGVQHRATNMILGYKHYCYSYQHWRVGDWEVIGYKPLNYSRV